MFYRDKGSLLTTDFYTGKLDSNNRQNIEELCERANCHYFVTGNSKVGQSLLQN